MKTKELFVQNFNSLEIAVFNLNKVIFAFEIA
jgi:hypothetical protein